MIQKAKENNVIFCYNGYKHSFFLQSIRPIKIIELTFVKLVVVEVIDGLHQIKIGLYLDQMLLGIIHKNLIFQYQQ